MQKVEATTVVEEGTRIVVPKTDGGPFHKLVFYNDAMAFNRSVSSLAVGASGVRTLLDGLCATGARGIRYALENSLQKTTFVDANLNALPFIKKNVLLNKLSKKSSVAGEELNHFLTRTGKKSCEYDWLELDPFGTPVFFLDAALRKLMSQKKGVLSVTSTDLAKLCGKERQTCIRHYDAFPLRCEFSHELAVRIMLATIVRRAAVFDLFVAPKICFFQGHAIKIIAGVSPGAQKASESLEKLGWLNYCPRCHNRNTEALPSKKCFFCGGTAQPTGPLWLQKTSDEKFLEKMVVLNAERSYSSKQKISSFLQKIIAENSLPPFFFDLHAVAASLGKMVPAMESVMQKLKSNGFVVAQTHYCPTGIRTDADWKDVAECFK